MITLAASFDIGWPAFVHDIMDMGEQVSQPDRISDRCLIPYLLSGYSAWHRDHWTIVMHVVSLILPLLYVPKRVRADRSRYWSTRNCGFPPPTPCRRYMVAVVLYFRFKLRNATKLKPSAVLEIASKWLTLADSWRLGSRLVTDGRDRPGSSALVGRV